MSKFKLAIGLHNHQPVGNFDFVFDESHRTAYQPFLELLKKYPAIRISLHQSGILWSWQKQNYPEYLSAIKLLVEKNQIDLLTGGFYEPIMVSIPANDALGQVLKLTDYIKEHFDYNPSGAWLTERIWEPHLPKLFNQAGINFIPVDDTHFIYAGFEPEQLTGPFVTEFENYPLTLLPISKKMRYLIPFGKVSDVIDELKKAAEKNPEGMMVYADDGEKFGSWPNTYQHCYKDGWLKQLFEALSDNSDWLEIIPLNEAALVKPIGRAYLPSASYAEMLHWSLPFKANVEYEQFEHQFENSNFDKSFSRFIRGGHWRGFLTKYEEVNLMHKKMMAVSQRLQLLENKFSGHPEFEIAREALYAGQCNCPYWHGVFGGLYLPHIRQAVYSKLIEAEAILNKLSAPEPITVVDYNLDGHKNIIVSGAALTAVFDPQHGGSLIELSLLKHKFSLTDCLSRRKEGYHHKLRQAKSPAGEINNSQSIHDLILAKEEGLENILQEDWYLKRCFIDHIFTDETEFEQFESGKFGEVGDFVIEAYKYTTDKTKNEVTLFRDGKLWKQDQIINCRIEKKFSFDQKNSIIHVEYALSVEHDQPVEVNFAIENNFNFQAGHADDRYVLIDGDKPVDSYLDSLGVHRDKSSVSLVDSYRNLALDLNSSIPSEIWHCPIHTVSLSEGGFEKVYQGTTLVNRYKLTLTHSPVKVQITLNTGSVDKISTYLKELKQTIK